MFDENSLFDQEHNHITDFPGAPTFTKYKTSDSVMAPNVSKERYITLKGY